MVDPKAPQPQQPSQQPSRPPQPPVQQPPGQRPQPPGQQPQQPQSPPSQSPSNSPSGAGQSGGKKAQLLGDMDGKTQKQVDVERKQNASGNWRKEEGDVVGENPASIDFVGAYPWPNVSDPGENRDDDTPISPPFDYEYDQKVIEAKDKADVEERGRVLERRKKQEDKFRKQLAEGTAPPPYSHTLNDREQEENSSAR